MCKGRRVWKWKGKEAYLLVLLIKVVQVSVEDLDEELNRDCRVHACVCDSERTLQTFEDAFTVAVELD